MPESKSRKKATYTPPPQKQAAKPNPRWWVPVMLGLMVVGLLWIVVFYIGRSTDGSSLPLPFLGTWNLAVGASLILVGFGMTTRWR
ncbi:cell division protein CrgA [Cellulomonas composti]|uniref:Cell division protein CrgA n=1 Tax=Cellulomonas composti TaxID=266130 RepID=A0A511JDM5_9CELL|nr:cell division protein CrgA [Cellulomonas composti]GEL96098.1 cell division protein CrgA [Cellulomonas composti]